MSDICGQQYQLTFYDRYFSGGCNIYVKQNQGQYQKHMLILTEIILHQFFRIIDDEIQK